MAKAEVRLVVHIYGASGDITVGQRMNAQDRVDVARHTGIVVTPEVIALAQKINKNDVDIANTNNANGARVVAKAAANAIDPDPAKWDVQDMLLTKQKIWDPRQGWVTITGSEFAYAFRLMRSDGVGGHIPHPYSTQLKVNGQSATADFIIVVQTPTSVVTP